MREMFEIKETRKPVPGDQIHTEIKDSWSRGGTKRNRGCQPLVKTETMGRNAK